MAGKKTPQDQRKVPQLSDFIDMNHELVLFAHEIQWDIIEKSAAKYYSNIDQPPIPIRFVVGCMLLKHLYNLGDDMQVLEEVWIRDLYMQYFTGEKQFKHRFPCELSDFVRFCERIGTEGMDLLILQAFCMIKK